MTPAEIIEALKNSPNALQIIIDSLGMDETYEHYWGLEIVDGTVRIHYEYYGFKHHVPMKYIHKDLIPLHSHVGLNIPYELYELVETNLAEKLGNEFDKENRRIVGSTHPSHHDIISFVLHGHAIFGICSKYTDSYKISFYDTDAFEENDFRCILETLIDEDSKINNFNTNGNTNLLDLFTLMKNHIEVWENKDCLKLLDQEPYSAHLVVPL